jgi:ferredoxin
VDVLRWPLFGAFLRWRHARRTFQLLLLLAAAVVVLHGLFGPQTPTGNLAPVLTWVHYRGLLIVALLAAGNLFCAGCPFVLVRDAGRRFLPPSLRWPRRLRTKWIALSLFVAVLFAYELFDLWALPRATAYLVIAYFVAALLVDLLFSGATFCKYLCPVGQFNFVASTMSPLELRIREEATCRSCRTADCIKGRWESSSSPAAIPVAQDLSPALRTGPALRTSPALPISPVVKRFRVIQRGCELNLFLPLKVGNMDCTFCLDCVHACPHDNIALAARLPGVELADPRRRSGIGWLARRWDIAVLAVLFAFGALLNAFAMVAPVYRLESWLARLLGVPSEAPVLAILFVLSLGVAPLVLVGGAAVLTRTIAGGASGSVGRIAVNYAYALVPFGFGMWLAHYGFHLLTGLFTVIPIAQNVVVDLLGRPVLGEPLWRLTGMRPGAVYPMQVGFILLGAMGSLALAYRISERDYPDHPALPTAPWAMVTMTLTTAALWILSQPMEMRGAGFLG